MVYIKYTCTCTQGGEKLLHCDIRCHESEDCPLHCSCCPALNWWWADQEGGEHLCLLCPLEGWRRGLVNSCGRGSWLEESSWGDDWKGRRVPCRVGIRLGRRVPCRVGMWLGGRVPHLCLLCSPCLPCSPGIRGQRLTVSGGKGLRGLHGPPVETTCATLWERACAVLAGAVSVIVNTCCYREGGAHAPGTGGGGAHAPGTEEGANNSCLWLTKTLKVETSHWNLSLLRECSRKYLYSVISDNRQTNRHTMFTCGSSPQYLHDEQQWAMWSVCWNYYCVYHTSMLFKEATHTTHYLVCLGGGVEGSSVEWSPILPLVPLLEGDTHHRGGEGGWKTDCRWRNGSEWIMKEIKIYTNKYKGAL